MMNRLALGRALTVCLGLCLTPLRAQGPAATPVPATAATATLPPAEIAKTHAELRALRDGLVRAVNASDLDGVLSYLHPNVVVTFQNAEVCRGHQGVRDFFNKMMTGPDRIVRAFHISPTVDELTTLYGDDAGVAFGAENDEFDLTSGMKFQIKGRWTATLVKENGHWLVASFHTSSNLFDNAMLDRTKKTMTRLAFGTLIAGLLAGFFGARILGRKRA